MTATAHFSESYGAARRAFLAACADAGAVVENHRNPTAARGAEELFTDVARIGAPGSSQPTISECCKLQNCRRPFEVNPPLSKKNTQAVQSQNCAPW